jgi:hypothetical protein
MYAGARAATYSLKCCYMLVPDDSEPHSSSWTFHSISSSRLCNLRLVLHLATSASHRAVISSLRMSLGMVTILIWFPCCNCGRLCVDGGGDTVPSRPRHYHKHLVQYYIPSSMESSQTSPISDLRSTSCLGRLWQICILWSSWDTSL